MIKNINNLRWVAIVFMAIITVIGGVTIVQAWTTPSSSNVSAPITASSMQQHKDGKLTLSNNLIVGRHLNTSSMNIANDLTLAGKTNCNLKTDVAGNVMCASGGGPSSMTGPFQCDGTGGGGNSSNITKTCDIPGSAANQVCFLTQAKAFDWDNIDAIKCHVYYTAGGWKMDIHAADFREIVCSASCIQL